MQAYKKVDPAGPFTNHHKPGPPYNQDFRLPCLVLGLVLCCFGAVLLVCFVLCWALSGAYLYDMVVFGHSWDVLIVFESDS